MNLSHVLILSQSVDLFFVSCVFCQLIFAAWNYHFHNFNLLFTHIFYIYIYKWMLILHTALFCFHQNSRLRIQFLYDLMITFEAQVDVCIYYFASSVFNFCFDFFFFLSSLFSSVFVCKNLLYYFVVLNFVAPFSFRVVGGFVFFMSNFCTFLLRYDHFAGWARFVLPRFVCFVRKTKNLLLTSCSLLTCATVRYQL